MQTRCKAGELAVVTRPLSDSECSEYILGRIVQVAELDLLVTLFTKDGPVWRLATPIPCPAPGCQERWYYYADRCLRPLRDKPSAGENLWAEHKHMDETPVNERQI